MNEFYFIILIIRSDILYSECCYIDDRVKNINLASQLGLKTILFNRSNITYEGKMINDFQELMTYLTSTE
jgi:FMN phosphatase YigB (HAD superfamily)